MDGSFLIFLDTQNIFVGCIAICSKTNQGLNSQQHFCYWFWHWGRRWSEEEDEDKIASEKWRSRRWRQNWQYIHKVDNILCRRRELNSKSSFAILALHDDSGVSFDCLLFTYMRLWTKYISVAHKLLNYMLGKVRSFFLADFYFCYFYFYFHQ